MFFSSLKIRFLPVVAWEVQVIDYMSIQIEYNHWKEKNPDVLVSKNGLIFCLHITIYCENAIFKVFTSLEYFRKMFNGA
jgi:hypothetical protein